MCRFLAYIGKPVMMYDLLFKPKNSLINQSIKANEAEEPLNGDGFGVGWYTPDVNDMPGLFVSVRPAWNDRNLKYIAPKIVSDCLFAHVRAATSTPVNELNCHPFHFGNYLFMHNGDIEGFHKIKREMVKHLPENIYSKIEGLTDSEHLFALFLHQLDKQRAKDPATRIANALEDAIVDVEEIKARFKMKEPSYINACVTNGDTIVAVRYVSDLSLPASTLYFSQGKAYECQNGICRMKKSKNSDDNAVLIVSEKLTRYRSDWHEVPVNSIITVNRKLEVNVSVLSRALKTNAGN